MPKTSPAAATPLRERLEKLATFEPQEVPVLSLYLNLSADQHGRDNYQTFVRKVVGERQKAFRDNTPERLSFDQDVKRLTTYLADEVNRESNGVAIFACSAADGFFEAIQLDAPVDEHWLFVGDAPHLYPLARLVDQYPRYASVVLDTHRARIFVFSLGATEQRRQVISTKTRRNSMGGWSQARYQRRADNFHLLHIKEVVETLDKIVRQDNIQHIVVAGDDVVVPLLKEQLPQRLIDKLVDVLRLETYSSEDEILEATLEAMRQKDAETDEEKVKELLDAWQGTGLGVVGAEATLHALSLGQVDELLISGSEGALRVVPLPSDASKGKITVDTSGPDTGSEPDKVKLASELVKRAEQTAARVRFIENADLLSEFGGVGALLRFRV